jgi:hypothetical protein
MELVLFEVFWFGVIFLVIWLAARKARQEVEE